MTVVEMQIDGPFVGLDNAELNIPAPLAAAGVHVRNIAVLVLIGATQVAWLGTLGYFAFVFVTS